MSKWLPNFDFGGGEWGSQNHKVEKALVSLCQVDGTFNAMLPSGVLLWYIYTPHTHEMTCPRVYKKIHLIVL